MLLFPEIRRPVITATGKDPYLKFKQHEANAKARGVEFDVTFPEWWEIWQDRFALRGPHRDEFVMCRAADQGAYRPGNVRIDTTQGNAHERIRSATLKQHAQAWDDNPEAADWLTDRSRYGIRPEQALRAKQQELDD